MDTRPSGFFSLLYGSFRSFKYPAARFSTANCWPREDSIFVLEKSGNLRERGTRALKTNLENVEKLPFVNAGRGVYPYSVSCLPNVFHLFNSQETISNIWGQGDCVVVCRSLQWQQIYTSRGWLSRFRSIITHRSTQKIYSSTRCAYSEHEFDLYLHNCARDVSRGSRAAS